MQAQEGQPLLRLDRLHPLAQRAHATAPARPEHLFQYDQPHILTVLGSYNFGNGWEFGARFRLISGLLATPNVCDPTSPSCDPFRTSALFDAATGTYVAIPASGPFSERLPIFHQLDLRVDKRWSFKRWKLSAYLDVQNAYNQPNVEGYSLQLQLHRPHRTSRPAHPPQHRRAGRVLRWPDEEEAPPPPRSPRLARPRGRRRPRRRLRAAPRASPPSARSRACASSPSSPTSRTRSRATR